MDALNTTLLVGEYLRERAHREVSLLTFMLKHAGPEAWAKADQAGLKPEAGNWVVAMNRHRDKRAATKHEADDIVRRTLAIYGNGEACLDFLSHALRDPVWALRNLKIRAGDDDLGIEI